jgi:hypothetical protein
VKITVRDSFFENEDINCDVNEEGEVKLAKFCDAYEL